MTTTTKIFPKALRSKWGVLQYKWGAYCDTNGRSTDSISLSSERRGTRSPAIQIGGVLQYRLEASYRAIGDLGLRRARNGSVACAAMSMLDTLELPSDPRD